MILIGISILLIIIGEIKSKYFSGIILFLLGLLGVLIFPLALFISTMECKNVVVARASIEQSLKNARENTNFIEQAALSQTIIEFNTQLAIGQRYANIYLLKDFYTDEYRQLKPLK